VTLSDQLLTALAAYGLPVLFGVVVLGSAGLPIPGVVVVIASGALVHLGQMNLWWVLGLTCAGAVLGDSIGYLIGRLGGRRLAQTVISRSGGERYLRYAEGVAQKWGGLSVFLSRWLLTPLGAALNLASGLADYPYHRFLLFDIPGEALYTLEYVLLGELLSDRIAALVDLLGQVTWVLVGLIGAAVFGWNLYRYLRKPR
jgi:membrane-associated protein